MKSINQMKNNIITQLLNPTKNELVFIKVLPKRFHLIGNTTGLRPENQKFERQITTPEYYSSKLLYSYRVRQNPP